MIIPTLISSAKASTALEIFKPSSLDTLSSNHNIDQRPIEPTPALTQDATASTASHSSDVNNLASLSSDSGIQFGKMSEMSGSGEISGDSEKSPKHDQVTGNEKSSSVEQDQKMDDERDDKKVLSGLKRTNSVKARANLFQQLESKLKDVEKPPQKPKRGEKVD